MWLYFDSISLYDLNDNKMLRSYLITAYETKYIDIALTLGILGGLTSHLMPGGSGGYVIENIVLYNISCCSIGILVSFFYLLLCLLYIK